jgi:hypothetical protein
MGQEPVDRDWSFLANPSYGSRWQQPTMKSLALNLYRNRSLNLLDQKFRRKIQQSSFFIRME